MKVEKGSVSLAGFQLDFAGYSDIGQVRSCNEDDFLVMPEHGVFCVADGVGGLEAGDVASKMALDTINMRYLSAPSSLLQKIKSLFSRGKQKTLLEEAIHLANARIFSQKEHARKSMATTLAAMSLKRKKIQIAHVGDCRVYLYRNKSFSPLTRDHSLVAELYLQGAISHEQIRNHPHRHIVTRAVGAKPKVTPSILHFNVLSGDTILLCSDGLNTMLEDEELAAILQEYEGDVEHAGSVMVREANRLGGKDNITLVLVRFT